MHHEPLKLLNSDELNIRHTCVEVCTEHFSGNTQYKEEPNIIQ